MVLVFQFTGPRCIASVFENFAWLGWCLSVALSFNLQVLVRLPLSCN